MLKNRNNKGFTLIELLIVIVIIGILAGVLVAVIDPGQQQNRARDANVQAAINKVALSAEGFNSAYGRTPDGLEFVGSLQNATASSIVGAGCTSGANNCQFTLTGNALPVDCAANGWQGPAAATPVQCEFNYERYDPLGGVAYTNFRIFAKSYGIEASSFCYDSADAAIVVIAEDAATC